MKKLTTIVIVGAAVGAAIWFFNTAKGKEVLGSIKDTSNDLADKLKSQLNSIKETASGVVESGKQYVSSVNGKVQEAVS